jgi:hypothetical protein
VLNVARACFCYLLIRTLTSACRKLLHHLLSLLHYADAQT